MTRLCQVTLPAHYRTADVIAYHLRDRSQTGEKWDDGVLYKGLIWQGQPACLSLRFDGDQVFAHMDTDIRVIDEVALAALVRKMLGLDQDIDGFEHAMQAHPQLGPLIRQQRGLRVPVTTTPFEALVWAIIGQQISVQAAISIRRRFIQAAGHQHHNGLWCHPDPSAVLAVAPDTLRSAGLSATKVRTLHAASEAILQGQVALTDHLGTQSASALQQQLVAIRGIGTWTADYTLLRGYGWLDGSLHGDAAVRRSLRTLLQQDEPVSQDDTREWLKAFSPWRALAAAHLWAALKLQA